ncbi:MAG TPA: hypothetical protein VMI31_02370 [Fimbriimonadaceae bacterium]|nr:hypothetical protein [Fimbriimonadaceae bacterium]
MKKILTQSIAVIALGAALMAPTVASAQSWHRQTERDNWKNLAIGAGVVGLIGALSHNDTLAGIGAAGAFYSAYRYDADGRCYGRDRRDDWVRIPDRDRNRDRDHGHNWRR